MVNGAAYVAAVGNHPAAGTLAGYFGIPPAPTDPLSLAQDVAALQTLSVKDLPLAGAAANLTDTISWLRTPSNWGRIMFVAAGGVLIIVGVLTMITGTQAGKTAVGLATKAAVL